MTDHTTDDARRLVARLRSIADHIESAARYGVAIPYIVSAGGHEFGDVTFSATEDEFAEWVDYLDQEESLHVEDYTHEGKDWSRATVTLEDGLTLSFATKRETAEVTA